MSVCGSFIIGKAVYFILLIDVGVLGPNPDRQSSDSWRDNLRALHVLPCENCFQSREDLLQQILNIWTPQNQNLSVFLFLHAGKPECSGSSSPLHTWATLFIYWLSVSEYPNCDLERCRDCVSEKSLLRRTNAKSLFKKKLCCQTLTCCCANVARRGKRSVMQLIYKRTRNLQTAAPPLRRSKQKTNKMLGGYNATMSSKSMILYKKYAILNWDLVSFNPVCKSHLRQHALVFYLSAQ